MKKQRLVYTARLCREGSTAKLRKLLHVIGGHSGWGQRLVYAELVRRRRGIRGAQ